MTPLPSQRGIAGLPFADADGCNWIVQKDAGRAALDQQGRLLIDATFSAMRWRYNIGRAQWLRILVLLRTFSTFGQCKGRI